MPRVRANNGNRNGNAMAGAQMRTVTIRAANSSLAQERLSLFDQTGLAELRSGLSNGTVDRTVNGSTAQYDAIVDWLSGLNRINIRIVRLVVIEGANPLAQVSNEIEAWRATPWHSAAAVDLKIIDAQYASNFEKGIRVFETNFFADNATQILWNIEPETTVDFSIKFPYHG